jgi:hypothetical protein
MTGQGADIDFRPEDDEPLGSTPWSQPQKWLGFFFGALLVVIAAGKLIG